MDGVCPVESGEGQWGVGVLNVGCEGGRNSAFKSESVTVEWASGEQSQMVLVPGSSTLNLKGNDPGPIRNDMMKAG